MFRLRVGLRRADGAIVTPAHERTFQPRAACAYCESTNTRWEGRRDMDLHCLDCGSVEFDAGIPEHHRSAYNGGPR